MIYMRKGGFLYKAVRNEMGGEINTFIIEQAMNQGTAVNLQ